MLSLVVSDRMADNSAPPTQDVANLHLDEVTGERVSKSELKKRQKQRDAERRKAEKAAAAPPKPAASKPKDGEMDESNLTANVRPDVSRLTKFS